MLDAVPNSTRERGGLREDGKRGWWALGRLANDNAVAVALSGVTDSYPRAFYSVADTPRNVSRQWGQFGDYGAEVLARAVSPHLEHGGAPLAGTARSLTDALYVVRNAFDGDPRVAKLSAQDHAREVVRKSRGLAT
jgi:hypothetical protein